ncbi:MAG: glycoside hydrolase [Clostridia bacterium]|nr:glycoside hydrolase [Clostridia bacterium]
MGFNRNEELTIHPNKFVRENKYIKMKPENKPLPTYEQEKDNLPRPIWDGHDDTIRCYDKAWQLAFKNLCKPKEEAGYVSNYIDTAFNGCIFMWDSVFMLMFGKYGARSFDFQGTLNNFYSHQYNDGYICREIEEDTGNEHFTRFDPSATGPEIMAWCEWEYFKNFGDTERLADVFPCLMAYHEWMREFHTWRDGTYWSSGWGCGMDNLPRMQPGYSVYFSHGHMIWNDACMQELMNCKILIDMAKVLGREEDTAGLKEEREHLIKVVNEKLWDEKTAFYYDLWKNGRLNFVKHIGAYWALLAEIVPEDKKERFISHLTNEKEFAAPCMIPALSQDHPAFSKTGEYWNGGIWAPTNYMVLIGLDRYKKFDLSHKIAVNYLKNVVSVFNSTGTLFENYAPMPDENGKARQGSPARPDFVGWTGLAPISVLFEFVFGIKPDAENNTIDWHIELTERHGVEKYPFGNDATLTLLCEERNSEADEPVVHITSNRPVKVKIFWDNGKKSKVVEAHGEM